MPTEITTALRELAGGPATGAHDAETTSQDPPPRSTDLLPLARGAAVSILLMLGVGAVFGAALRPGGVESLAGDVVVVVHHRAPTPTTIASVPTTTSASAGSGASGAAGAASSSGSGSGGSSGGSGGAGGGASGSGAGSGGGGSGSGGGAGSGSGAGSGGGSGSGAGAPGAAPATRLPPIRHVWEIVLSDQGYAQSFGTSKGHAYLSKTLAAEGELITQYDAVASSPLANEIALVSGQGPTEQTVQNCPTYSDITPGNTGKLGQVLGAGCVYPASTETIGEQLRADAMRWRAYIQGIGSPGQRHPTRTSATTTTTTTTTTTPSTPTTAAPATTTTSTTAGTSTAPTTGSGSGATPIADTSTAAACPHPAENATDGAQTVGHQDGYVTWKNPWVYFRSTVDHHAACASSDVGLRALATDLRRESTTPALSYIAPDPCDDGSDTPCRPGAKGGLPAADAFLHAVIPKIEHSAAYRAGGLILITFDEAPQSGPEWSTGSCCGQPTFPNLPAATTGTTTTGTTSGPTTTGTTTTGTTTTGTTTTSTTTNAPAITGDPPGGGQVGLLMISPYVKPHTLNTIETYNHFSLLKSLENLFRLPHLGYTADQQVPAFIPSLFLAQKRKVAVH